MLADADEKNRHVRRMHDTDYRANHVTHGITFGYDEPIKTPAMAE